MIYITCLILLVLLFFDQLTKYLTMLNIGFNESINAIPNFLTLTKTYNTGAAWGMLSDTTVVLVMISIIGTVLFAFMIMRNNWKTHKLYSASTTLLLAGCFGNLIDRFLSITPLSDGRPGVVDMISFEPLNGLWNTLFHSNFPIFNLADTYLTIGVVLLLVYIIFIEGKDKNDKENN